MIDVFTRLISDNEQDRAEARTWWKECPLALKMEVWDRIQAMGEKDTIEELVSRLAALAFATLAEEDIKEL